jgi:hypothetical protein
MEQLNIKSLKKLSVCIGPGLQPNTGTDQEVRGNLRAYKLRTHCQVSLNSDHQITSNPLFLDHMGTQIKLRSLISTPRKPPSATATKIEFLM